MRYKPKVCISNSRRIFTIFSVIFLRLNYIYKNINKSKTLAGGYSREVTPDPIPNSVVKTSSADGTAVKTVGEQVVASLFSTAVGADDSNR